MDKASAKEYYERIILLRVQLFLRAVVFSGTVLIFSKLHYLTLLEKPLGYLKLQESYAASLAVVFSVSAAAATIDIPIRYVYKRIARRIQGKTAR